MEKKKRLGDMLVQEGLLTPSQLDQAVDIQRNRGGRLGDILVELKHCTEDQVLASLAKRAGLPFVSSLSAYGTVDPSIADLISPELSERWGVVALARDGGRLTVAMADPFIELNAVDDLAIHTGLEIHVLLTSPREIQTALKGRAAPGERAAVSVPDDMPVDPQRAAMFEALMSTAIKIGADHIFLEPTARGLGLRWRVRGQLERKPDLPMAQRIPLTSYVKSRARMDVGERWVSQVGRIQGCWEGRTMDVQVTTLPTIHGEKVVLALSEPGRSLPLDLSLLGLEPETLEVFRDLAARSRGLLLVAGPARSGKSATLYAALASMDVDHRHILTIEDPIDRHVEGITQVPVRPDQRMSLAGGLHVLRRQNPDVIMLTEIADVTVAEMAVDAAGECLVLSTVTASDGLGAIRKLLDLGVPPGLLAERLVGLLGQKLVRKVCPRCREGRTLSLRELMSTGLSEADIRGAKRAATFTVFRGKGCGHCLATGYDGVFPVFEVIPVSDELRRLIGEKAGPALLAREVAERVSLREAAMKKALAGETSVEEALREN